MPPPGSGCHPWGSPSGSAPPRSRVHPSVLRRVLGRFSAFFCPLSASDRFSGISLSKSLFGSICPILLPSFHFACLACPAAFSQIIWTADQLCPKALHAAVRAAAADVIELPASRCRIDKEVPVQFVSLCHSWHSLTSFLPETVSAQKSLCFFAAHRNPFPARESHPGVTSLGGPPPRVPAMPYLRPMTGIQLSRCGCPEKIFRKPEFFSS